jgi:lambda repressor-like predicted transcriptional regulator
MQQEEIMSIIEAARAKNGISLRKMGTDAGLSHATYQSALKYGKGMSYETVRKLLDAVGYKLKVVKQ